MLSHLRGSVSCVRIGLMAAMLSVFLACPHALRAEGGWTTPTAEELHMTAEPHAPGAAAIYLNRDITTDDLLHTFSVYIRIKVLTDAGKDYGSARVDSEHIFYGGSNDWFSPTIFGVAGRTIHPDGTIIPFTGKPETRDVVNAKGYKLKETDFALPAVEAGSILEYRYSMETLNWVLTPSWAVQQDLFVRKSSFSWKALATDDLSGDLVLRRSGAKLTTIAWASVLPPGAKVNSAFTPRRGGDDPYQIVQLNVENVPALPDEKFMPPARSFEYRVNFYRSADVAESDFWKDSGHEWEKARERFIGSPSDVAAALKSIVSPGDSDDVKLHKIYAQMMLLDNTTFSRRHSESEDKAAGLGEVKTVQDIWARKRGNDDQITWLFIALARAAGFTAYPMRVTSRDKNTFSAAWRSWEQMDDDVAIVLFNGTEQFFDPGQRYCAFGQLAWKHTGVEGVRELANEFTTIARTPQANYADTTTQRTGDLTLQADGSASGTLQVAWTGAAALEWRQKALQVEEDDTRREMKHWIESLAPDGTQAEVTSLDNLTAFDKPLVAHFSVHGPLGTVTAKRLMIPGAYFQAQATAMFPEPSRTLPVYFHYGERVLDGVQIHLPANVKVESLPQEAMFALQDRADYRSRADAQGSVLVLRRKYDLTVPFFAEKDYPEVHTFYNKLAAADQQSVVLQR